jgi:hypothetical protein
MSRKLHLLTPGRIVAGSGILTFLVLGGLFIVLKPYSAPSYMVQQALLSHVPKEEADTVALEKSARQNSGTTVNSGVNGEGDSASPNPPSKKPGSDKSDATNDFIGDKQNSSGQPANTNSSGQQTAPQPDAVALVPPPPAALALTFSPAELTVSKSAGGQAVVTVNSSDGQPMGVPVKQGDQADSYSLSPDGVVTDGEQRASWQMIFDAQALNTGSYQVTLSSVRSDAAGLTTYNGTLTVTIVD